MRCPYCGATMWTNIENVMMCYNPPCQRIAKLQAANARLLAACEAALPLMTVLKVDHGEETMRRATEADRLLADAIREGRG